MKVGSCVGFVKTGFSYARGQKEVFAWAAKWIGGVLFVGTLLALLIAWPAVQQIIASGFNASTITQAISSATTALLVFLLAFLAVGVLSIYWNVLLTRTAVDYARTRKSSLNKASNGGVSAGVTYFAMSILIGIVGFALSLLPAIGGFANYAWGLLFSLSTFALLADNQGIWEAIKDSPKKIVRNPAAFIATAIIAWIASLAIGLAAIIAGLIVAAIGLAANNAVISPIIIAAAVTVTIIAWNFAGMVYSGTLAAFYAAAEKEKRK